MDRRIAACLSLSLAAVAPCQRGLGVPSRIDPGELDACSYRGQTSSFAVMLDATGPGPTKFPAGVLRCQLAVWSARVAVPLRPTDAVGRLDGDIQLPCRRKPTLQVVELPAPVPSNAGNHVFQNGWGAGVGPFVGG